MKTKTKTKTYQVEVTRTTYDSMSFDVEAKSEEEAEEIAYEMAENASWGTGNADYEIESLEEVEGDKWEERNERQAYNNNN